MQQLRKPSNVARTYTDVYRTSGFLFPYQTHTGVTRTRWDRKALLCHSGRKRQTLIE